MLLAEWKTVQILICVIMILTLSGSIYAVFRFEQDNKDKFKRVIKYGIPLCLVIGILVIILIF
jgi:Na+-driven multidrug efflux pump